jgi:hypothetical protein
MQIIDLFFGCQIFKHLNIIQQDCDNNIIGDIGHKAVLNTYFLVNFTLSSGF